MGQESQGLGCVPDGFESMDAEQTGEGVFESTGEVPTSSSDVRSFWDFRDMRRPDGCPPDDMSGITFDGGFNVVDRGVAPGKRVGFFLGGRNCVGLAQSVSTRIKRVIRGE